MRISFSIGCLLAALAVAPIATAQSPIFNPGSPNCAHLSDAGAGCSTNPALHPGYVTGRYYTAPVNALGTLAISSNTIYAMPFYVGVAQTFTKASIDITATGTATSCEIGYYANSAGAPGARLADLGSVVATGIAQIELTGLSVALTPGFYFLAVGCNGTATLESAAATNGSLAFFLGGSAGNSIATQATVAWTFSAGNLPTPFGTATYTNAAASPLVYLRF